MNKSLKIRGRKPPAVNISDFIDENTISGIILF